VSIRQSPVASVEQIAALLPRHFHAQAAHYFLCHADLLIRA
jgi:hypothetical protein